MHAYFTLIDSRKNHKKHYFLRMSQEGVVHVINFAWGRIGNALQQKKETFNSRAKARARWNQLFEKRTTNGYDQIDPVPAKIPGAPSWWPSIPAQVIHAPSKWQGKVVPSMTLCGTASTAETHFCEEGKESTVNCPGCNRRLEQRAADMSRRAMRAEQQALKERAAEREESPFEKRKRLATWNF